MLNKNEDQPRSIELELYIAEALQRGESLPADLLRPSNRIDRGRESARPKFLQREKQQDDHHMFGGPT